MHKYVIDSSIICAAGRNAFFDAAGATNAWRQSLHTHPSNCETHRDCGQSPIGSWHCVERDDHGIPRRPARIKSQVLWHLPLGEVFEGAWPFRATKATLGKFVVRDCSLSPSTHRGSSVIRVKCDHASIDSNKYEVPLKLFRCGVYAGTCMVSLVIVPIVSLQPTTHQSGTYHKFHGRVFQLGYHLWQTPLVTGCHAVPILG